MTTIEKPTVPTPVKMLEVSPALNQGNLLSEPKEVDTFDRPVLGQVAMTREEYADQSEDMITPQSAEVRSWEEQMALDETEQDGKNALKPIDSDDDIHESELDGFTVVDTTRNEEVDELPEDLELGEPDDDEVHEQ